MDTSDFRIHLQTQGIDWSPDRGKTKILNHISINVKKNEFVGIVGPNGSGKTSLLRCLYRSLKPQGGDITLDQRPLQHYSNQQLAQKIAVVNQDNPTDIELLVSDILRLGYIPFDKSWLNSVQPDHKLEAVLVKHLDLSHLLHRSYKTLSGGEKQRVMIARALIQKPAILILDEPSNHLDITHQISLLKWIKRLDVTVICSLHDLNLAAQFCDSIALMQAGKLIEHGSPQQVFTSEKIQQIFSVNTFVDTHPVTGCLRLSFY